MHGSQFAIRLTPIQAPFNISRLYGLSYLNDCGSLQYVFNFEQLLHVFMYPASIFIQGLDVAGTVSIHELFKFLQYRQALKANYPPGFTSSYWKQLADHES